MRQFKHLDYQDRCNIQLGLTAGYSYCFIAKFLNVNRSTIKREVERHIKKYKSGASRSECKRHVCNGCSITGKCVMKKQFYYASEAENLYKKELVSSRQKNYISKVNIDNINELLSDGISRGLGLYSIMKEDNNTVITICEKTLRKYIDQGLFAVKNYHLREKVKRKRKKQPKETGWIRETSKKAKLRFGRLFSNFLKFKRLHPKAQIVEVDTVHGKQEDKYCILTLMFVNLGFQIGLKVKKYNTHDVNQKIRNLFSRFTKEQIKKLFAVMLADNGEEFDLFPELEMDENGEQFINTFFTRPYRSTDKAKCERNHRELRKLFPKGRSLDHLTQEEIDEAFSHLNSTSRKVLDGKTPNYMMKLKYGKAVFSAFGIKDIPYKKVRLKPLI